MSGLAIAFPAEAAAPIARKLIDAISDGSLSWGVAAAGVALLLTRALSAGYGQARTRLMKTH